MKYGTLIETLTEAVAEFYRGDPSTAGLVVARIETPQFADVTQRKDWYASIVRYSEPMGRGKRVVCSAKHPTSLKLVLVDLATQWQKIVSPSVASLDDLAKMLGRFGVDP